jgi:hypothetical protein
VAPPALSLYRRAAEVRDSFPSWVFIQFDNPGGLQLDAGLTSPGWLE